MMIGNIRDHRKRPHRWKRVNAVIEALEYDNSIQDADQTEAVVPANLTLVDDRDGISVAEAIIWASEAPYPVTLFLYDAGEG